MLEILYESVYSLESSDIFSIKRSFPISILWSENKMKWNVSLYYYSFIVGSLILHPLHPMQAEEYRDWNLMLLRHTMKVINIYNCLFTNQKPLTALAKGQNVSKMELFGSSSNISNSNINIISGDNKNSANSSSLNQIGHFGNELIYWKLYQTLKCAYDNYRVSTNHHPATKQSFFTIIILLIVIIILIIIVIFITVKGLNVYWSALEQNILRTNSVLCKICEKRSKICVSEH